MAKKKEWRFGYQDDAVTVPMNWPEEGQPEERDRHMSKELAVLGAVEATALDPTHTGEKAVAASILNARQEQVPDELSAAIGTAQMVGRALARGLPIRLADIPDDPRNKERAPCSELLRFFGAEMTETGLKLFEDGFGVLSKWLEPVETTRGFVLNGGWLRAERRPATRSESFTGLPRSRCGVAYQTVSLRTAVSVLWKCLLAKQECEEKVPEVEAEIEAATKALDKVKAEARKREWASELRKLEAQRRRLATGAWTYRVRECAAPGCLGLFVLYPTDAERKHCTAACRSRKSHRATGKTKDSRPPRDDRLGRAPDEPCWVY